jgi:hypothetical protein
MPANQDKLVQQQLGPLPPPSASPGMILQYNGMFAERKRSLVIDNVNGLIENSAAVLVKVRAAQQQRRLQQPATAWPSGHRQPNSQIDPSIVAL